MIRLIIPGEPQAKGRPRFFPIRTKAGRTFSRAVTPLKTRTYETLIQELFVLAYPGFMPMEGPLSMEVDAYLRIPKSASRRRRDMMEGGTIVPEKRPDVDNILKSAGDALNGLAFRDDSQIAEAIIRKRFSSQPRMIIRIGPVGEGKA
jgi:Holliday junction resolvase RusA-like endonuclease